MDCPRCGVLVPDGSKFCGECGTAIGWRCDGCGGLNPPSARFCGQCGSAGAPTVGGKPGLATPALPAQGADRRQITVVFCDMVGSTALGARLDPEDLREVVAAYHGCVTGLVTAHGGFVARYMGDGVLVYFGYPTAHEDDAERAVRAGLAVTEAVTSLNTIAGPPGTLSARVGIATGLVVAGELIGSGPSLEQSVVGDTPNLAARMQTLADPGTVVIADATQRLTGGFFEYRELTPAGVKGYALPVRAWTVLRENKVVSRFKALRAGTQLPLFGRDDELGLLLRRWERARNGEGSAVLLVGEAGIGKSRLTAEVEARLSSEPLVSLQFFCAPHYQNSALHPVIHQLTRDANFLRDDDVATRHLKLSTSLARSVPSAEDIALLADLLSLPVGNDCRLTEMTPQRRKERTLVAIQRHLESLTRDLPVLMIFEDMHWADQTTLELLDRIVEQLRRLRMLLVVTSRPDLQPAWIDRPQVSMHLLNRLDRQHMDALINGVAGEQRMPEAMREQIMAHSDGVPLFVEELTKTVLENTLPGKETDRTSPLGQRPAIVVPSSLQDSLMSRLDRLGSAKEIAQMGAVFGREFSLDLFQLVFAQPDDTLVGALQALSDAGLVVARGQGASTIYSFKHALVQEAAHSSMLRDRRRMLHLQVASALERDTAETAATDPVLLAHHYTEAGAPDRAIDYHLKAAERAMVRCAIAEMVNHLRRGLALLRELPDAPATRRRELTLQVALGRGLIDQVGSASDEGYAAFVRARELCIELNDTELLLPTLFGLQVYHFTHADPETVISYADEILDLGQRTGSRQATLVGHRVAGSAYLLLGRLQEARTAYERLLDLYQTDTDGGLASDTTRDPFVAGCSFLAICLSVMGFPTDAATVSDRGLRHAEYLQHPISTVFALRRGCIHSMLLRDIGGVKAMSHKLLEIGTNFETFLGSPEGLLFRSWALLNERNEPALHRQLQHSLDQLDGTQTWALLPFLMSAAAELKGKDGDRPGAAHLLNRAVELVRLTGEKWCEPEITRLRALFVSTDPIEAAGLLRSALDMARTQGAKLWELRIATDLASLLRAQGEHAAAHGDLAPVCSWFPADLVLPDLMAARAMLASLAGNLAGSLSETA